MWSPRLYEKRGGSVSTRVIFRTCGPLGNDNPMKSIAKHEVGIDVSMDELVTSVDGGAVFKTPNTIPGLEKMIEKLPKGATVHLEASGGYERLARKILKEKGFDVRVHNPLSVRLYARATGGKAKTDPLDAKALCAAGPVLVGSSGKSAVRESLADISRAIDTLKGERSDFKRRMRAAELHPEVKKVYQKVVKDLDARIQELDQLFVKQVKSVAPKHQRRWRLLCADPRLGDSRELQRAKLRPDRFVRRNRALRR